RRVTLDPRPIDLLLHLHARRRARHVRYQREDRLDLPHLVSWGGEQPRDRPGDRRPYIHRRLVGVHDGHGVVGRDAVAYLYRVLEELAHLIIKIAVSNKGCPHEGLVGVFGWLLLAGLVEGGEWRGSSCAHGEARRAAEERLHCHDAALRARSCSSSGTRIASQAYSALSVGLLSPSASSFGTRRFRCDEL
ncbi:unnamed protein product, partial [Pelagomonas calceolata]